MLEAPNELQNSEPLSKDEARKHIAEALARGTESIAAEIATAAGLEAEYPALIAKVDAEGKMLRG